MRRIIHDGARRQVVIAPADRRSISSAFLSGPLVMLALLVVADVLSAADKPWPRHTIDDSSRGADGVRIADVNGDGRTDLVTGWEEGGVIRVYLQPAKDEVRRKWPAVTVGKVRSPEDAVFVVGVPRRGV